LQGLPLPVITPHRIAAGSWALQYPVAFETMVDRQGWPSVLVPLQRAVSTVPANKALPALQCAGVVRTAAENDNKKRHFFMLSLPGVLVRGPRVKVIKTNF